MRHESGMRSIGVIRVTTHEGNIEEMYVDPDEVRLMVIPLNAVNLDTGARSPVSFS